MTLRLTEALATVALQQLTRPEPALVLGRLVRHRRPVRLLPAAVARLVALWVA